MSRCVSRYADSESYGRAASNEQRPTAGGEQDAVHTHRTTSNERRASADGSSDVTAARPTTRATSSDRPGLPRPLVVATPEQTVPLGVHNGQPLGGRRSDGRNRGDPGISSGGRVWGACDGAVSAADGGSLRAAAGTLGRHLQRGV